MDIKLKNFKHIANMSEETHCFTATIYIDGVKAGEVSNRGHGGPNEYSSNDIEARLNAYGKTLPTYKTQFKGEDGKLMELEIDAEIIIADLVNDYLTEKDLKRILSNRIAFTKTGEKGIYQTGVIAKVQLATHLQNPEKIKSQFKNVDQILNLMPFSDALKTFKTHNNIE